MRAWMVLVLLAGCTATTSNGSGSNTSSDNGPVGNDADHDNLLLGGTASILA